jgi:hypothetical protein
VNITEYLEVVQLALSTPAQQPSLHMPPAIKDGTDLPQYLFWYGVTLQLSVHISSIHERLWSSQMCLGETKGRYRVTKNLWLICRKTFPYLKLNSSGKCLLRGC